jgi:hypothetical protein
VIRHLLAPGLLGPLPAGLEAIDLPRLPAIERLLGRADRTTGPEDLAAAVCSLFGVAGADDGGYPTAALCYRADTGEEPRGWVMHADPVHLRPDQDRLLLFDARSLGITDDEAQTLVQAFNRHFGDDGFELVAPRPERWYLLTDRPPSIRTRSLPEVVGRSIDAFLPVGPDQEQWRRLLNETQMLFFGLSVNEARETRGLPGVSGIWLSGVGRLPARGETLISSIEGADPLVRAAAGWSVSTGNDQLRLEMRPMQALLDADGRAWVDALQDVNDGLADWLGTGDSHQLHLCNGTSLHWRPTYRRRIWRRPKAFAGALDRLR